jgi:hypothetical protein
LSIFSLSFLPKTSFDKLINNEISPQSPLVHSQNAFTQSQPDYTEKVSHQHIPSSRANIHLMNVSPPEI